MAKFPQFRDADLSLWQSAVDEVVARQPAAAFRALDETARPDEFEDLVLESNEMCADLAEPLRERAIAPAVKFCPAAAFRLAKARLKAILTGNNAEVKKFEEELGVKFGNCDVRWAQVIEKFVAFKSHARAIPYRTHSPRDLFVRDLPDNAAIALIADWGTGQKTARQVLALLAAKQPDVVIHLGDIYYSGTQHEADRYFYEIWQQTLGIPRVEPGARLSGNSKPLTFSLSGNHDMYSGGVPYYRLIDRLGQPASYFCLRNRAWQFLALDTGFFSANLLGKTPTSLHASEAQWLHERVAEADGRKTVLLSHHQLFTAYQEEREFPGAVNPELMKQVADILPQVTVWFWGHEHNLVVFESFSGVLARCIGHGAIPVEVDLGRTRDPDVPIHEEIALAPDTLGGLFSNGYVMLRLAGSQARATYYQFDGANETTIFQETL